MNPKFNLEEVKNVIRGQGHHRFASSTAITPIIVIFKLTIIEAKDFIKSQLLLLEEQDFSTSIFIRPNVYDIYGKIIDGILFYIKFTIEKFEGMDCLFNISFHPASDDILTKAGVLTVHRGKDI